MRCGYFAYSSEITIIRCFFANAHYWLIPECFIFQSLVSDTFILCIIIFVSNINYGIRLLQHTTCMYCILIHFILHLHHAPRTFHVTCFTWHSMKSLGAVEPIIFDPIQSETCLLQPFVKPIGHWQFSVQLKRLNYCLQKISFLLICRGRYLPTQLGWWARISWLDMTGCAKSVGYCSRQWLDLKTRP